MSFVATLVETDDANGIAPSDVTNVVASSRKPNSNIKHASDSANFNTNEMSGSKELHDAESNDMYQYLVLDSGPIIKRFYSSNSSTSPNPSTSMTRIWEKARYVYTVPAVINEIRDANARQYLQSLPFDIILQEPNPKSIQQIIAFAKLTGDYHSLSYTDIQVLALLYDLEVIGCNGSISHIRTTPKRKLGLGKIETLNSNSTSDQSKSIADSNHEIINQRDKVDATKDTVSDDAFPTKISENDHAVALEDYDVEDEDHEEDETNENYDASVNDSGSLTTTEDVAAVTATGITEPQQPMSWASLLRPATSTAVVTTTDHAVASPSVLPSVEGMTSNIDDVISHIDGQFSDASEDGDDNEESDWSEDEDNDNENKDDSEQYENKPAHLERELQSDFPSLAASLLVPYEDETEENKNIFSGDPLETKAIQTIDSTKIVNSEARKVKSLKPISKSGKLYNSFTRYKDLMKPKSTESTSIKMNATTLHDEKTFPQSRTKASEVDADGNNINNYSSRIIGSSGNNGQMGDDFEDDGEGWITTTKDITKMKAAGVLDPSRTVNDVNSLSASNASGNNNSGPLLCQRAACVTTDFAMQNVILQMNLELLSLDGIRVRKLKNWVTRCGACYTVYTNNDTNNVVGPLGKRLFCEKCGSDLMQRIAASVDGKTGRLRLHLSKKYQYNLRGTKFSLPKPGTGNRFQGDLLLREDQLLMGAWNQKLKMISGGKARDAAQSIFGRDIATNVGCHANSVNMDDIRVGFGRRNPNAVKGRERRGKKKKSVNTACGLRRY